VPTIISRFIIVRKSLLRGHLATPDR